ncbi:MAG: DUF418 domain-containing protein [Woeseiaceae bacterium]|nr:DUF418 domain-containing protein [Woeseiaceae bacterium]
MVRPAGDPAIEDGLVGPVETTERLVSLDVLRGVAVLGILVMNIYGFAMPFAAYTNPLVWGGTEWPNLGTWFVTHVVFDQKFMAIFSMLFGAGLILMYERAQAKNAAFGKIFFRRQVWLMLLGLLHAYLIWFGDILFMYAVVGMLAYLFRNLKARSLIICGCILLLIAPLLALGGGAYMQDLKSRAEALQHLHEAGEVLTDEQQATIDEWDTTRVFLMPGDKEIAAEVEAYRGSYTASVEHRIPFVVSLQTEGLLFFGLWRVGGLMLIGMALMKIGVLGNAQNTGFYRKLTILSYTLGLSMTIFSAVNAHAHQFDAMYMFRIGSLANYFGSVLVAFGHIGLLMLLCRSGALVSLLGRFAAVGQMALTNYLMHSVVMTAIFYGWGLGLYGEVPRVWQMAFVLALIGLQLILSPWWLGRFRFGPLEWMWRSLTYGRRQPLVRK